MSKEIDLDFDRDDERQSDRDASKEHNKDYEQLNDKINAIDDRVTDLENNERDKDSISSTAKSNVRPFSDNNIYTHNKNTPRNQNQ